MWYRAVPRGQRAIVTIGCRPFFWRRRLPSGSASASVIFRSRAGLHRWLLGRANAAAGPPGRRHKQLAGRDRAAVGQCTAEHAPPADMPGNRLFFRRYHRPVRRQADHHRTRARKGCGAREGDGTERGDGTARLPSSRVRAAATCGLWPGAAVLYGSGRPGRGTQPRRDDPETDTSI